MPVDYNHVFTKQQKLVWKEANADFEIDRALVLEQFKAFEGISGKWFI